VFRVSVYPTHGRLSFGCFLIRDDAPAMIETSFNRFFDLVYGAVTSLIDPSTLRYIVIPHFEMDECGSLNRFLEIAPQAEPVAARSARESRCPTSANVPPGHSRTANVSISDIRR